MPNLKSIISAHNRKVLNRDQTPDANKGAAGQNCNCADKTTCPLNNNCKVDKVIYRAKIESEGVAKFYIGSTIRTFKKRYTEHKYSIKNKGVEGTRLSDYVWGLKSCNKKFDITWEILDRARSTVPGKICSLCNLERIYIASADRDTLLNKRSELIGKCRHFPKFYHYN
jgi:hypothetical protein